jgi:hypothetical protein
MSAPTQALYAYRCSGPYRNGWGCNGVIDGEVTSTSEPQTPFTGDPYGADKRPLSPFRCSSGPSLQVMAVFHFQRAMLNNASH